jgi:hypothetical protein
MVLRYMSPLPSEMKGLVPIISITKLFRTAVRLRGNDDFFVARAAMAQHRNIECLLWLVSCVAGSDGLGYTSSKISRTAVRLRGNDGFLWQAIKSNAIVISSLFLTQKSESWHWPASATKI